MKIKIISILFIIILTTTLFSCMTTSLGEEISFGYTPQEKYKIGRNVGANILGTYNLYYNETLYTYLNSICNTIIINSDKVNPYKGYSIGVLDTNIINAFATPGGHILISRGMLRTAKSEDELAAIIAHEISHIQLEHSIKAIKKNTRVQNVGIIATVALAIISEQQGKSNEDINDIMERGALVTSFSTELLNTGYSKKSEYMADEMAIHLLEKTGYNPNSMKTMLENLKNNKSKNYSLGFGKTHPSPKKRIKNANKTIKQINRKIGKNYNYNEESRESRFKDVIKYF